MIKYHSLEELMYMRLSKTKRGKWNIVDRLVHIKDNDDIEHALGDHVIVGISLDFKLILIDKRRDNMITINIKDIINIKKIAKR